MAMLIQTVKGMGFEVEWDAELQTILCKNFESCKCCRGFLNLCDGGVCANMGMCVCIYSYVKNQEYEQDQKRKELQGK